MTLPFRPKRQRRVVRGLQAALCLFLVTLWCCRVAHTAPLNLPDTPLFVTGSKTALVQLVIQRDNKLFFEAYPSYEDINGDGVLDIRYKPGEIDYYGYYFSDYCYDNPADDYLEAVANAVDKKCASGWSGDYLNFLTMTRMDIMLKSLYGGKRHVDVPGETILRRAFVPWENHTWGIEYNSIATDGYDIREYSPLALPVTGTRHLLSTSNYLRNDVPYLRVRENTDENIWEWVDKERTQGDGWASREVILDVQACKVGFLEDSCQQYSDGGFKPIGLLHEYGENDSMYFSLLTGSFENNLQGGVLRQTMESFGTNEVNPVSGVFTRNPGIVTTLDALQIPNDYVNQTVQQDCGWITDRPFMNGECRAWGNPIAEMMFEGLRYFSGVETPTPEFYTNGGMDAALGLSAPDWDDPYSDDQPYAQCSSAHQLVVSDPSPSFDSDQLPGSYFGNFSDSALPGLNVGVLADFISGHEDALPGLKFIGQVGDDADGSPSPKYVTTFSNIRGQSPEAPHRQGSYYAPSVAYYGRQNDINPGAEGEQTVGNYTLALGSPLPSIDVSVGGSTMSFAPFAKTVYFCGQDPAYKPTNAIVGFTVESITDTTGSYRISYEDMEQGGDNDMDAVVRYSYEISGGEVHMTLDSLTASGCALQHIGFTVSGSTDDGVYLLVRDADTRDGDDRDYELDVPAGESPGTGWNDGVDLPLTTTVTFTPSDTPAAEQLPSPLWYAAKWGGFNDTNGDGIPQQAEWDANGDNLPDNYFPVSDPSLMADTMRSVFNQISEEAGAASSIAASSSSLQTDSRIYQASFTSGSWTGELSSYPVNMSGEISGTQDWNVSQVLAGQIASDSREILTYNPNSAQGVPFVWPVVESSPAATELSASQVAALNRNPITDLQDTLGLSRLNYLRGNEVEGFRERAGALGDIINSSPLLVPEPSGFYPDDWGSGAPENLSPYSDFVSTYSDRNRVVYVGANDGMLHGIDAGTWDGTAWSYGTGEELFAYVPAMVFDRLSDLTSPTYTHLTYVDSSPRAADVFINEQWRTVLVGTLGRGGQGLYALDVTDPAAINENTANATVLWEFTDQQDADVGYIYSSPVIARMKNGRWAAIVANGYNNSVPDVGYQRGNGWSSVLIIDIETGDLIRKLHTTDSYCEGSEINPNGMAEPTAIDIDGDNIVDTIYAGDLYGCLYRFDVSSASASGWSHGELKHKALDTEGNRAPITSGISVGSHPTGLGVMLYFGTGKYLEPSDQTPAEGIHRFYGLWDKGTGTNTVNRTRVTAGNLQEQYITLEDVYYYDSDNDGTDDASIDIRESSSNSINWEVQDGWYMDLAYDDYNTGEQLLATPQLRDGKIIFGTHIPSGDACFPGQQGWLMILNSPDGSMLTPGAVDVGISPTISGIGNAVNPFAPPTIVAAGPVDVILSQSEVDPTVTAWTIWSSHNDGRLTWRELQP